MKQLLLLLATVTLTLPSVAAGATPAPPPRGGTIAIEPEIADGDYDGSMPVFVDAAAEALTARGFTVFDDPGHAASVVELLVSRSDVGTGLIKPGRGAASIIGAGASIPLSTGTSQLVRLQRTRLELRIHRRGDTAIVWDGAAVTVREANGHDGTDGTVAADLIRALLQSYPVAPKGVVGVP